MRKKSTYKPKGVRLDVATWVINGFKPVSATGSAVLDLKIKNHSALEALRTGQAKRYDIDFIISALNPLKQMMVCVTLERTQMKRKNALCN